MFQEKMSSVERLLLYLKEGLYYHAVEEFAEIIDKQTNTSTSKETKKQLKGFLLSDTLNKTGDDLTEDSREFRRVLSRARHIIAASKGVQSLDEIELY